MTDITRLKSDINGNSRWAVHFTDLEPEALRESLRASMTLTARYARIVRLANTVGGRRYHCKAYGNGIVFQAYEHQVPDLIERIRNMQQEPAA